MVGIGMAITWYRTSDLNQCSILHGSTGGGGYGGGGSASVTTAAGYGADQSYASVTGWVDGNYIEGGILVTSWLSGVLRRRRRWRVLRRYLSRL